MRIEKENLSINTSLGVLFENEQAKELVLACIPFFADPKNLKGVEHLSFRQALKYNEEARHLVPYIEQRLREINKER